jgi:hypothetical protein
MNTEKKYFMRFFSNGELNIGNVPISTSKVQKEDCLTIQQTQEDLWAHLLIANGVPADLCQKMIRELRNRDFSPQIFQRYTKRRDVEVVPESDPKKVKRVTVQWSHRDMVHLFQLLNRENNLIYKDNR